MTESTMTLVAFIKGKHDAATIIDSIKSDTAENVEQLELSQSKDNWKVKILVTGGYVDGVIADPDAFVAYLWEELGEYAWMSITAFGEDYEKCNEKYTYTEYKEMTG